VIGANVGVFAIGITFMELLSKLNLINLIPTWTLVFIRYVHT
jgi:hypothetical protein